MRHMGSPSKKQARPILLACTQCRLRHLRCDGTLPQCTRCLASNASCEYLKSRRGGKKKQKSSGEFSRNLVQPSAPIKQPVTLGEPNGLGPIGAFRDDIGSQGSHSNSATPPVDDNNSEKHVSSPTLSGTLNTSWDQAYSDTGSTEPTLAGLFYEHFHRAHPILVSQDLYHTRQYPAYLISIVNLIGSRFLAPDRAAASLPNLIQSIQSSQDGTVCLVQARLLFSVFLCGEGEMELAKSIFVSARDLAIELQMYRYEILETYFLPYGELERESFKRTWWELYVADGHMTAIWPELGFLTSTLDCNVPIACDETPDGSQHTARTPLDIQFRPDIVLTEEDGARLPAWWFRIKAVSLLGKVISQARNQTDNAKAQSAMNALATWRLLLPEDKLTLMDPYGKVNELMFEAEVMVQFATILLHFSRSNLNQNVFISTTVHTIGPDLPIRSCTKEVHGIKATEASKEISNLFSIYPSMAKCSPLMISCLSLCGMVQLATCYAHAPIRNCLEIHRDRVSLLIGVLGSSGRVWQQAKNAQSVLKNAALETFKLLQPSNPPRRTRNSAILIWIQQMLTRQHSAKEAGSPLNYLMGPRRLVHGLGCG
ncbi:hypothetical protein N7495_007196 [Penicillium taxi]|uniref:uncharacterized protein n=1 Tax=Penicillium taxi TaxID=168475 RepID=UPI002544E2EE|nr:uncharacterized protein N7495_007196 [Penicillium taxi]KAJ5895505.1 hypothetical protein N7495_007196 [Penicillium taxi]